MYISGLGAIDDELYDACTVDGGGRLRKALSVTIPGIMNVIIKQYYEKDNNQRDSEQLGYLKRRAENYKTMREARIQKRAEAEE